jgi:hypothetical protein
MLNDVCPGLAQNSSIDVYLGVRHKVQLSCSFRGTQKKYQENSLCGSSGSVVEIDRT